MRPAATIYILVYVGFFYGLWAWRHWAAIVWAIVGLLLLLVFFLLLCQRDRSTARRR